MNHELQINGLTDSVTLNAEVSQIALYKGDEGKPGIQGEKGEPFRYEDFTTEQLESLKGADGYSPTVNISKSDNVTTVIVIDKNGVSRVSINDGQDGKDGQDGYTPIKGVDYFDGANGTDGRDGRDGVDGKAFEYEDFTHEQLAELKGEDGISPTVSTSKSGKITTLTITDKNGAHAVHINDGQDGATGANGRDGEKGDNGKSAYDIAIERGFTGTEDNWLESLRGANGRDGINGVNGEDGYTPLRGIDYWTDVDKAQIISEVIAALPDASEVSY